MTFSLTLALKNITSYSGQRATVKALQDSLDIFVFFAKLAFQFHPSLLYILLLCYIPTIFKDQAFSPVF